MILELIKKEYKKYIWNPVTVITIVFTLSLFAFMIVQLQATNHSGHIFSTDYTQRMEEIKEYKQNQLAPSLIDDVFMKETQKMYETFVNKHSFSKDKIEESELDVDVTKEPYKYDFEFCNLFPDDVMNSKEYKEISQRFQMMYNKQHIKENLMMNNVPYQYSSEGDVPLYTAEELRKIDEVITSSFQDKPYVAGLSFGADILSSNLQFIPFFMGTALIICLFPVFGMEKVRRTDALILTTRYGKRQYIIAKVLSVISFTILVWILFQLTNLILTKALYGLDGMNVTTYHQSMQSPYGFTYLEYYLHQLGYSFLATIVLSLIISLFSQMIRPIPALFLCLIINFISSFMIGFHGDLNLILKLQLLTPSQLISSFYTFDKFIPYTILGRVYSLPQLSLFVLILSLIGFSVLIYLCVRHRQIKR